MRKKSDMPEDTGSEEWREFAADSIDELGVSVGRHSKLIILHSIIIVAAVCAAIVLL